MLFAALCSFGSFASADAASKFTTYHVPGDDGGGTSPNAVNEAGTVTGFYFNIVETEQVNHGFVRGVDGSIAKFDPPRSVGTEANCIDHAGDVAGEYIDDAFVYHSFLRTAEGTIISFDPPGSSYSVATGINDAGKTIWQYGRNNTYRGFIRTPAGTIKTFRVFEAFDTAPAAINNNGVITGAYAQSRGDTPHGFVRAGSGTAVSFDPPRLHLDRSDEHQLGGRHSRILQGR